MVNLKFALYRRTFVSQDIFPVDSSNTPADNGTPNESSSDASHQLAAEPNASMQEFYQLQQSLLRTTLFLTGIIVVSVWVFYSLNVALNYFIGACTGVVYLKMLAKNVAQLGREKQRLSNTRLALLIGIIVIASRVSELQIMPIFLGFLTYKVAVIFYMVRTTFMSMSD